MLTPLTQTALAVLNDIACGELSPRSIRRTVISQLLVTLESHGLICLLPGHPCEDVLSYRLACPAESITLLDVLEATGEHLNCNHEMREEMYCQYGVVAHKLGIVNLITRKYLSEIKLFDL